MLNGIRDRLKEEEGMEYARGEGVMISACEVKIQIYWKMSKRYNKSIR